MPFDQFDFIYFGTGLGYRPTWRPSTDRFQMIRVFFAFLADLSGYAGAALQQAPVATAAPMSWYNYLNAIRQGLSLASNAATPYVLYAGTKRIDENAAKFFVKVDENAAKFFVRMDQFLVAFYVIAASFLILYVSSTRSLFPFSFLQIQALLTFGFSMLQAIRTFKR
jgi:hypothetical protein